MRFSIVITTHDRLALLKRAIQSALAQTVPCEVVVSDDCSSRETQLYVEGLIQQGNIAPHQLVYHRNGTKLGHSGTMNAGVQVASGDWIKPHDDDDYLASHCIERMMQAIETSPNAVICSCQAMQVDADGNGLSKTRTVGSGKAIRIPQQDIHYGMLLEQVPFGTPIQVAFRRDAFLKTNGWDTTLTSGCDIDFWVRVSEFGDAIFINECLTYRTVWSGGSDQKIPLKKRMITNIQIKEKIYERVSEQHRSSLPTLEGVRNYLYLHWGFVALRQKDFRTAMQLLFPAFFLHTTWKLLFNARLTNQFSALKINAEPLPIA